MSESYQDINFHGEKAGKIKAYSVINILDLFNKLKEYSPKLIKAYGYYGAPSPTAVSPFSEICFMTIACIKNKQDVNTDTHLDLDLPPSVVSILQNQKKNTK